MGLNAKVIMPVVELSNLASFHNIICSNKTAERVIKNTVFNQSCVNLNPKYQISYKQERWVNVISWHLPKE